MLPSVAASLRAGLAVALLPILLLAPALLAPASARAQAAPEAGAPDTVVVALPPIEVTATPFTLTADDAPLALTRRTRSAAELNTAPGLALDRLAYTVPGLWINSRSHYALGGRMLVRGLGWRASFGVRGVQVLLDGLPLTMADGQTVLNVIDPAFVRAVEVIRGPASTFWGNASGGVLALSTRPAASPGGAAHRVRVRQIAGSFGLRKTELQVTPEVGPHRLSAYGSYLTQDGFRAHSSTRLGRAGLTSTVDLGARSRLRIVGAFAAMPEANSPGTLDRRTARAAPTSARDVIVRQDVGKTSYQGQLGATLERATRLGQASATAYGLFRELENPIPSDYIDLSRRAGGLRLTLEDAAARWTWGAGAEVKLQRDDRREYANEGGAPGALGLSQLETVRNGAVFGRAARQVGRWRLSAGLRYDALRFAADDRLGAASGARTFQALSPSLGLSYSMGRGHVFANLSTALEAPTTTELSNRPGGQGGFNPEVGPEHVLGVEVGARGAGHVLSHALSYDVALFALRVRDLLSPYQLEADGPTFFRNAGRTRHVGLEAALTAQLPHHLHVQASYTLTRAAFVEAEAVGGAALDENRVPGVPPHVAGLVLGWRPEALHATLEARGVSSFYVDTPNTARNDGYVLLHARLSHPGLRLARGLTLQPFVSIENVLDARYNDVIVNAFGGRYYGPAAGRHWQAGLALTLD